MDFSADQEESYCLSCGKSVKILDAENHLQNIKAIAGVILGQFRQAKAGHRIALEWHMSKMAVAIPFDKKCWIKPAMNWLVEKDAIKLITSDIQLIEITQSGLNLLDSLENRSPTE
jgi:hypothetical protein